MKISFRVDASPQIGSGHVMRCLTLAETLRAQGTECRFICRVHEGNLIGKIRQRGFTVTSLPAGPSDFKTSVNIGGTLPVHAAWLGCDWRTDANQTHAVLHNAKPDWLVVDHYALDQAWESALRQDCRWLMVIDDLADRPHTCDLLLDQNLGRHATDYTSLIPEDCIVMIGPKYALLRPEFSALREYSLKRRQQPKLQHILITMGGVDQLDATGQILDTLCQCQLPGNCRITVVMGIHAPWVKRVQAQTEDMPWPCEFIVNVSDMAEIMTSSDLAICGGGGTVWECCALGLPSLTVVLAQNQKGGANAISTVGAAWIIDDVSRIATDLPQMIEGLGKPELCRMSESASALCDGCGVSRVVAALCGKKFCVRPMCEDDLEEVLRWRNYPGIRRFMYTQNEISVSEHKAWYMRIIEDDRNHLLLVVANGTDRVGFVRFTADDNGNANWGFYAAPEAPRGTGRYLAKAALDYAFNQLGFNKIFGEVIVSNERSVALHRKLGFHDVGLDRYQNFHTGVCHEIYRFSLLFSDWEKRN
jgi:UDP-2,4-diacetamido-2,4,6-trideoxy-beta-L-altropyranose hydrolase/UDP-4-amino-4,6-dideoxy-N-acetyl-beta-L-altrosamine N-acetyltransferase